MCGVPAGARFDSRFLAMKIVYRRHTVFPIDLLRVANDLVIADTSPGAYNPSLGNRHRPAVACEGGAFNANRARQLSRAIVAYKDALRRLQRAPLTLGGVPVEVHGPDSGNGLGSYRVKRCATT